MSKPCWCFLKPNHPKCQDQPVPILGCMDSAAINYNPDATQDDGSCEYAPQPPASDLQLSNFRNPTSVNRYIFSYHGKSMTFNTSRTYGTEVHLWDSVEGKALLNDIVVAPIRLFGGTGTIGYHPTGTGMGYIESEVGANYASKNDRYCDPGVNVLDKFIDFKQAVFGSKRVEIIWVHNAFSNADEFNYVFSRLSGVGCDITMVELGNEYHLRGFTTELHPNGIYTHLFPTGADYINWALAEIAAIKAKVGNAGIKFTLPLPNAGFFYDPETTPGPRNNDFMAAVADAYNSGAIDSDTCVVHFYEYVDECYYSTDVDTAANCVLTITRRDSYNYLKNVVVDTFNSMIPGIKFAFTEWNIHGGADPPAEFNGGVGGFGNTLLAGQVVHSRLMDYCRLDKDTGQCPVAVYHMLHTRPTGEALIYPVKSGWVNVEGNTEFAPTVAYYCFKMFKFLEQGAQLVDFDLTSSIAFGPSMGRFEVFQTDTHRYLTYVNRSGVDITVNIEGENTSVTGPTLYAGNGYNYHTEPTDISQMITYKTEQSNIIPAFSFGMIKQII